jgi:hypothetical protein
MASMQHPVPDKLLVHIGDIIVSFALVEDMLQSLVGSLIREHQRVGQIITAELAFKNLRALTISLYKDRHGEDGEFLVLSELVKRAAQVEDVRNQIAHSLWASGGDADTVTRIKATAKEKRGIHFYFEQVGDKELAGIATEMKSLAADIQNFRMRLLELGKALNTPIQKQW